MVDDDFSGSTDADLTDRTWKKLERDLQKTGFREGALRGQEESFQTGFDIGYSEGFRIGEALGFTKAELSLKKQLNKDVSDSESNKQSLIDDNEQRRACVICSNEDVMESNTIEYIVSKQQEVNNSIISKLYDND